MLLENYAHSLGAVEQGVSRVIDVVPVGEVNVGGQEFGFDDQEAVWVE